MTKYRAIQWAIVVVGLSAVGVAVSLDEGASPLVGCLLGVFFGWQAAELIRRES